MANYKRVEGFSFYYFGDDGSAWSERGRNGTRKQATRMKGCVRPDGYVEVSLTNDEGEKVKKLLHVLILEIFVGPRPPKMDCCHYDGVRTNNALSNLRWDSRAGNVADTIRHGRHVSLNNKGSNHPRSKLTEEIVMCIRRDIDSGLSRIEVMDKYQLFDGTYGDIKASRSWKHIPPCSTSGVVSI